MFAYGLLLFPQINAHLVIIICSDGFLVLNINHGETSLNANHHAFTIDQLPHAPLHEVQAKNKEYHRNCIKSSCLVNLRLGMGAVRDDSNSDKYTNRDGHTDDEADISTEDSRAEPKENVGLEGLVDVFVDCWKISLIAAE